MGKNIIHPFEFLPHKFEMVKFDCLFDTEVEMFFEEIDGDEDGVELDGDG